MKIASWERIRRLSLFAILILCSLVAVGILMLYSAAGGHFYPWALKQSARFGVGLLLMVGVALVDIRTWCAWAYFLYASVFFLLIAVEVKGSIGMGGQRWIDLYVFNLQPSELMKIALVLALARYFHLSTLQETRKTVMLLVPLALTLAPVVLVMRQPDLGTAMVILSVGTILFFLAGVQFWKFLVAGGGLLTALPILWTQLYDYQKDRILIFLNPEKDPTHAGYHLTQSKIALGSGGMWGKGYMHGSQSHLSFLPEKQTDFIFTMFGEEFGFFGALVLLTLYTLLLFYGFRVAVSCRQHFGRLTAFGMMAICFLHLFINMGMVMGLLPVVGVPLPFISYGGTSLLTLLIAQGLIFSAAIHRETRLGPSY